MNTKGSVCIALTDITVKVIFKITLKTYLNYTTQLLKLFILACGVINFQ